MAKCGKPLTGHPAGHCTSTGSRTHRCVQRIAEPVPADSGHHLHRCSCGVTWDPAFTGSSR